MYEPGFIRFISRLYFWTSWCDVLGWVYSCSLLFLDVLKRKVNNGEGENASETRTSSCYTRLASNTNANCYNKIKFTQSSLFCQRQRNITPGNAMQTVERGANFCRCKKYYKYYTHAVLSKYGIEGKYVHPSPFLNRIGRHRAIIKNALQKFSDGSI